jgi:hypothetical protein
MTKDEFIIYAKNNNISERYYSLDGTFRGDDVVYVKNDYNKWEVYYFEKGGVYDLRTYYNENDAIDDVYCRFKSTIDKGWKYV